MHPAKSDVSLHRPWARGLDLDALAALGVKGADLPPPQIPGYDIDCLLGSGGLGHVWKGIRRSDSVSVALKIAHSADPALGARLQNEALTLQSLDHPHIVRCLGSGVLETGHGWLELEYVDGAPLSALIPPQGFSWTEARYYFEAISAAVIHAHAKGVLHRDLKPSNILIGQDGSVKVADFGLARPVAERVVTFSLTLSGHVAGTAEYLAPECYERGYTPAAAADLYALGVILYELLAGHPPRGAWPPVSRMKKVDIRIDDVLRKALEPDPAHRFPEARTLLQEVQQIACTPSRYAGTPRFTRPVRFMDFLWTGLGIFLLLGAAGLVVRIEKYGFGLPVDLIGTETIRIGTYQGIFLLLLCGLPFGLWQIFRLWHFRKVPMREALPSPFGLKLGTTRTAVLIVTLAQLLFLVLPGLLGAYAWRERCSSWLTPSSAPWVQGLVVSHHPQGRTAHDPWAWPQEGRQYFLRERSGWITDPLSTQFDMTSYWPGLMPRLLLGLTLFGGATCGVTVLSALARWWRFRKWGQSLALLGSLTVSSHSASAGLGLLQAEEELESRDWDYSAWNEGYHTRRTVGVREQLFPREEPPAWREPPEEMVAEYARTVAFDEELPRSGPAIAQWLGNFAAQSRAQGRSTVPVGHDFFPIDPKECRFHFQGYYLDCTDPPSAQSTGALTLLTLRGNILPRRGAEITEQSIQSLQLWSVERRSLPAPEATVWVTAFLEALAPESGPAGAGVLTRLFYPLLLQFTERAVPIRSTPSQPLLDALRAHCAGGSRPRLARPLEPALPESGGRQRLVVTMEDRGQPAAWTLDLIYWNGQWRCVRMGF